MQNWEAGNGESGSFPIWISEIPLGAWCGRMFLFSKESPEGALRSKERKLLLLVKLANS